MITGGGGVVDWNVFLVWELGSIAFAGLLTVFGIIGAAYRRRYRRKFPK